jgi:hypothetical protein
MYQIYIDKKKKFIEVLATQNTCVKLYCLLFGIKLIDVNKYFCQLGKTVTLFTPFPLDEMLSHCLVSCGGDGAQGMGRTSSLLSQRFFLTTNRERRNV